MPPAAAIAEVSISREMVLRHAQELPAAPQVLGGLLELLAEANISAGEVAEQIRVDPALAARVLRMSNSVAFGGALTVGSIEEAVTRIGIAELTRIVGIATVAGLVDRSLTAYGITAERLQESLLLHGLASEALARFTQVDPRIAYAGGLLRGVGMMVLERAARGRIAPTAVYNPHRFSTYSDWEVMRFGLTSSELTAILLDAWNFPPELIAGIEQHTDPYSGVMSHVLNLAGAVVAAHRLALPGDAAHWVLSNEKFKGAWIDEAAIKAVCAQVLPSFQRQRATLY